MSDEKTYTLDEIRGAFYEGAIYQHCTSRSIHCDAGAVTREARRRFPAHKKLREIHVGGDCYRVLDGHPQYRSGTPWLSFSNAEAVREVAKLLDNPYEET